MEYVQTCFEKHYHYDLKVHAKKKVFVGGIRPHRRGWAGRKLGLLVFMKRFGHNQIGICKQIYSILGLEMAFWHDSIMITQGFCLGTSKRVKRFNHNHFDIKFEMF